MRTHLITAFLTLAITLVPLVGQADDVRPRGRSMETDHLVVTATKTAHSLEDVPVETLLITREKIERSNARTVSGLLAEIPGFNFSQQSDLTGAMGYKNTVRGLNVESRYLLVLVDGQRVFTGYHSGGMASAGFSHNVNVVPVSMIERIEVVKGPGSALYGSDAMVGVMNIITRQPGKEAGARAGGGYSHYSVAGNNYLFATPEDKHRTRYEGHATVSGAMNDRICGSVSVSHEENEGINPTCYEVSQNYVNGQISVDATDALQLRVGAEFTDWQSEEADLLDKKTEEAPRVWAVADYAMAPKHKLKVQSYYQKLDADFSDLSYGKQQADVSYRDVEAQYTGTLFEDHLLTLGVEYLEEALDTDRVEKTDIGTSSAYLQDEWCLMGDSLILVPGVRFDDNDLYGEEWNPKFSAMYTPVPGTRFRFSGGCSFKAPTAMETSAGPIDHVVMWVVSNPSLEPERAVTWQAGLEQELLDQRLVVGATCYHSDVDNLIAMAPTGTSLNGSPVVTFQNVNEAEIQGVELSASAELMDELQLLLTYAYTDARDGITDKRLVNTPEHTVNAQLDYANRKYGAGGTLSLSHTSDQVNMDYGTGGSLLTEAFTAVGLKVWKNFMENGRISLEATNIFDEPLRGSDTIYVAQSVTGRVRFDF